MQSEFQAAMAKLAVVGQDTSNMVDCSELIPVPPAFNGPAVFPPSLTHNDIEQAVRITIPRIAFQTDCVPQVCYRGIPNSFDPPGTGYRHSTCVSTFFCWFNILRTHGYWNSPPS